MIQMEFQRIQLHLSKQDMYVYIGKKPLWQRRGAVSWTIESLIHILFLANLLHMSQMFSYCAASTLPPFRGEKIYCCFGTIPLKSKRNFRECSFTYPSM
ncbi:uncharacterized protein LOC120679744 isoform X2 [Panicum virgatum]|uniref:uncharacterized protein LOC120679744 isoform X2 n=1 Tax=Panicum virgatum TaxID=38727 RepID=UPI0019D56F92|nr:uncharacterized protein LOC120679744 isoform X2 [Panicum virgatum]